MPWKASPFTISTHYAFAKGTEHFCPCLLAALSTSGLGRETIEYVEGSFCFAKKTLQESTLMYCRGSFPSSTHGKTMWLLTSVSMCLQRVTSHSLPHLPGLFSTLLSVCTVLCFLLPWDCPLPLHGCGCSRPRSRCVEDTGSASFTPPLPGTCSATIKHLSFHIPYSSPLSCFLSRSPPPPGLDFHVLITWLKHSPSQWAPALQLAALPESNPPILYSPPPTDQSAFSFLLVRILGKVVYWSLQVASCIFGRRDSLWARILLQSCWFSWAQRKRVCCYCPGKAYRRLPKR